MIKQNICDKKTQWCYNCVIIILVVLLILLISLYNWSLPIIEYNDICTISWNESMKKLEIDFSKKYPMGKDYFRIEHYPKYFSFLNQFYSNKYYCYTDNNKNVLATCCVAQLKNGLKYICDLKSKKNGLNTTFKFIFYYYYNEFIKLKFDNTFMFGIVMQPNPIIKSLSKSKINKLFASKCDDLNLYQISYSKYLKIQHIVNEIFGNHFFVSGYKQLILESTKMPLKIGHLATKSDLNYVTMLQTPLLELKDYDIMFCIPKNNKYCNILNNNDIPPTSVMTIYCINVITRYTNSNYCWNFVRTYMI
jgi:hypothetical protein